MLMMLVLLLAKSLLSLNLNHTCYGFQARESGERAWKELQLMLMMLVLLLAKSLQSLGRSAALAVGSKPARAEKELGRNSS